MNLNASGVVGESTGTFSTPMEVVDSLGVPHVLTITCTKTAANEWDYEVTIPGAEISGGTPPDPFSLGTGTISFDSLGRLVAPALDPGVVPLAIPGLTSGAADLAIDWHLYADDGTPAISQYAQPSAMAAISQDGILPSQLVKVTLADGGRLLATYSNGGVLVVGQLALASVRNPDSLMAVGNNNLQATTLTSAPAIGVPQTGGRGKVLGSSLESSTVDIALEFATLIVLQRGYQANARVVTTVDDISQETINMKR
jgi:flagellar hook protein FlgE